mgnify:CR=1 FL=1
MTCLRCDRPIVKGFYCTNCGYVPEKETITMDKFLEKKETNKMYSIYRYFEHGEKELIAEGLTLEQVKKHCSSPNTHGVTDTGKQWFDGFIKE